MISKTRLLATAGLMFFAAAPVAAQSESARIMDEGLNRSQVMLTASELMDGIGPRLTASPNLMRAEEWAIAKFRSYGLSNIHREPFAFGRGWEIISSSAVMVTPRRVQMTAIPMAWSPPTDGTIRAEVIVAPMSKREHFAAWRGKLAGKIVMVTLPDTESGEPKESAFKRLTDTDFKEDDTYDLPDYDPDAVNMRKQRRDFPKELDAFLKSEGAVAWIKKSYRDGLLVHGEGYNYGIGETLSLPVLEVGAEDYRRLARLAKTGPAPTVELTSNVRFSDGDGNANNVIADIPGTDPKAGYVMAGAHFDSWVAGDGASDNGAGSAVVIEAARILKAIGARPKRTIRFALWEGEEQGLLGSRAYIEQHFVSRPGAPITCSCSRRASPATSSSRIRSIMAAASIIRASTRWTICAPTTCGRRRWLWPACCWPRQTATRCCRPCRSRKSRWTRTRSTIPIRTSSEEPSVATPTRNASPEQREEPTNAGRPALDLIRGDRIDDQRGSTCPACRRLVRGTNRPR
jgi:hypothetical protein